MSNNVIVACAPAKDAQPAPVETVLHQLGDVIALGPGLWYLSTRHWANHVAERLWSVMDNGGRLVVVDASGNDAAWFGLDEDTSDALDRAWLSGSLGRG